MNRSEFTFGLIVYKIHLAISCRRWAVACFTCCNCLLLYTIFYIYLTKLPHFYHFCGIFFFLILKSIDIIIVCCLQSHALHMQKKLDFCIIFIRISCQGIFSHWKSMQQINHIILKLLEVIKLIKSKKNNKNSCRRYKNQFIGTIFLLFKFLGIVSV